MGFDLRSAVRALRRAASTQLAGAALALLLLAPVAGRSAGVEARTVPDLDLKLVPIPAGTFTLGSPAKERGRYAAEGPQTKVTISKPFWLGATEVTQKQWMALMPENPSQYKVEANPVEKISWSEAVEFCAKLTERERSASRLPEGYVYALPTEAQWEYACRAGTTGDYAGELGDMAWYFKNTEGLAPKAVAQKKPNAWGLFDMHGNVSEWCADWYGPYPGGSVTDPRGAADGKIRIVRGGGWGDNAVDCRSAFRAAFKPVQRGNSVGFRVALVPAR
jgi:formylglycine-generating enzyme required for sulfatase activity